MTAYSVGQMPSLADGGSLLDVYWAHSRVVLCMLCKICLKVADLIGSSTTWFHTLVGSGHKYGFTFYFCP